MDAKASPSSSRRDESDESEYDSGKETVSKPNIKKKRYSQIYNVDWERKFVWIRKSQKGKTFFHCTACRRDYIGELTEITRHELTSRHVISAKGLVKQKTVLDSFQQTRGEDEVREGEVRLASFIVEHNINFNASNHLPPLIKAVCSDSQIAKKLILGRNKCSSIVKNALGRNNFHELIKTLKTQKFSLIVDESTDIGSSKHLCLVAKHLDKYKVHDSFLALLPLEESASADSLYGLIKKMFVEHGIDYVQNMIGFGSDGANTMMGSRHSLMTLLKNDIPNLFVMKCSCHSFAICCSYACKKLPDSTEKLLREIYKYFQYSPKKFSQFRQFQDFCAVKPHKMLQPSQTRWLSLVSVVRRVLEQWNALKLFFQNEVLTDPDKSITNADTIHISMENVFQKMYLHFLDFILAMVTDLNKLMQAEDPKIFILYTKVESIIKIIIEMFVKPTALDSDVSKIDYKLPHNLLPLPEVYLGGAVAAFILENKNLPDSELKKFRISCIHFYQELIDQIKLRFPFDRADLKNMDLLIPANICNKKHSSVMPLVISFSHIISSDQYNNIDLEWRLLRNSVYQEMEKLDFQKFWEYVSQLKNGLGEQMFPNIIKLVTTNDIRTPDNLMDLATSVEMVAFSDDDVATTIFPADQFVARPNEFTARTILLHDNSAEYVHILDLIM
uniref:Uncharacterized protein LOC114344781 n=1 Tax=Diabrotica virgifera virgifera TaxID=50390 RepID=A0A6P7H114_DIAVI